MKSTQNTIIKQKSGIYSSKKRKTATAVLILVVLCCLFSTITQATNVTLNNITLFQMYGYDETVTTQAWRNIGYTVISENNLITDYIGYGQYHQKIRLAIGNPVLIDYYTLEFEVTAKNISLTGTTSSYLPYIKIPQTSSTNRKGTYTLTNEYTDNGFTYRTYKVKIQETGVNVTAQNFEIHTYFTIVSAEFEINNFTFKINDEIYKLTNQIDNTINDIEDNAQQAHNAVTNDQYNYDDPTLAIRANNVSVNNALQYISEHIYSLDNIVLYQSIFQTSPTIYLVFMLSLTFALLSYVLFGKVI